MTAFPRITSIQAELQPDQAILISYPTLIRYLIGFEFLVPEEREAFLLIQANSTTLIQASFSPITTPDPIKVLLGCFPDRLAQHISSELSPAITQLLIDTEDLRVAEWQAVSRALASDKDISIEESPLHQVWQHVLVRQSSELAALQQAGTIAKDAFKELLPWLKAGQTELEVKTKLHELMTKLGSTHDAFPLIVAFGPHGALPHHQPDSTVLEKETAILIDFGATYDGFRSDITRSFWFGDNPEPEFTKIEKIVHQAYDAAFATLAQPKLTARQIDDAARNLISQQGYGDQFIHTTGHGLGLDIHEPPSLNWRNDLAIKPNMSLTIEPGIYLEGKFGYRYENTIITTKSGGDEITK